MVARIRISHLLAPGPRLPELEDYDLAMSSGARNRLAAERKVDKHKSSFGLSCSVYGGQQLTSWFSDGGDRLP